MSFLQANSELILSLAKLTSALLISFAAAPFLKRPALRATFWAGVLIILPAVVIATHGRGTLNILPQPLPAARMESALPMEARLQQPAPTVVPAPLSIPEKTLEAPELQYEAQAKATNWLAIVFFTGVAFSLLPVLISFLRIRVMPKKTAGEAALVAWARIWPQGSPVVPLYLTSSSSAPFTAGMIRAAVLLPESSAAWSPRRLRSTLYHEAAHISRRDPLVRVLASFVRALLWFHPLVWLAHRQLVAAQEEACDEIALAAGIPPDEYAEDLLETAKHSRTAFGHSLQMARWSQLGTRIQTILRNKQTEPQPTTMKNIATVILCITAAAYSLSTLGFSETPGASKSPADPNPAQTTEKADAEAKAPAVAEGPGKAVIEKKLKTIVIPRINFEGTSIEEAVDFLRIRSTELDTTELDPEKSGFNFVVKIPEGKPMPQINALNLRNVPLGVALKYICDLAGLRYEVEEFAIVISPLGTPHLLPYRHTPKEEFAIVISPLATAAVEAKGEDAIAKKLVHIGGQVRKPGPVAWVNGMTFHQAFQAADGATEFGSLKRVKLHRDGTVETYDLTVSEAMATELKTGDTIEVPQKNWFGQ